MTKPPLPRGWFTIPGVQTGERDIKERVVPLAPLLPYAKDATILDLGCAEGCISKWLIDAGKASQVHGLDKHTPWIETARKLFKDYEGCEFDIMDFDDFDFDQSFLFPKYDIVLCLNVAQKLKEPKKFLLAAAAKAEKFFVYSGPEAVLQDWRSNNVPLDVIELMQPKFNLLTIARGGIHREKGKLGVRLIFSRKKKKVRK